MLACSWNDDGTKYYMGYGTGTNVSKIRQFTAATAYQTASGDTEGTVLTLSFNNVADITFNPDGTKMYVAEHDGNLHQFTLTTAFDTSTAGSQVTVDVSDFFGNEGTSALQDLLQTQELHNGFAVYFRNDDGTKLYINSLWGMTKTSAVNGSPSPATVTGSNTAGTGTTSRTTIFAVIEFTVD